MPLATRREKQSTVDQMVDPDLHALIIDLGFVQARAAASDQPPRFAVARNQAAPPEQLDDAEPLREVLARDINRR